ncbi:Uncharacterised protein [Bacteroides fragilis NCTC 9343]|nr:Uncharacterised protein [Bacteroides fragilis NCTC 9343]
MELQKYAIYFIDESRSKQMKNKKYLTLTFKEEKSLLNP